MRLKQRWTQFEKAQTPVKKEIANSEDSVSVVDSLPDALSNHEIKALLYAPDTHKLEHLTHRAVNNTVALRQMNRRLADHKGPEGIRENLDHAHLLWKIQMKTLEMIAEARQSLQRAPEPEACLVAAARRSLSPLNHKGEEHCN